MQVVSSGNFTFPNGFPEAAKDLITQLLVMDPDKRIGGRTGGYGELKSHPFFKNISFDTIHVQTPPQIKPYPTKLIPPDQTGQEPQLQDQVNEKWKKYLMEDETIVETGLVWKRKGRSVKKRQLILTNKPRIIYIDTKKGVQKGEVPWSPNLRPEAKNNTAWFIHTPKRTYILEDIPGKAQRWVDKINGLLTNTSVTKKL